MDSVIHSAYYLIDNKNTASHYHDCHQIIFVENGKIEIAIDDKLYLATDGDIVIVSRFERHSIKILSKDYKRYILRIRAVLPIEEKVFSVFTNRPENFCNIIPTGALRCDIQNILNKIVREVNISDSFTTGLHSILVSELLIDICRLLPLSYEEFDNKNFVLIEKIKKEFENNYSAQYELRALADRYNISTSSLSHIFKKITGVSVMEYLLSCRIAAAKRYLSKTDKSVGDIVELCGFSDNSNFSRKFKEKTDMSPSAFRKMFFRK